MADDTLNRRLEGWATQLAGALGVDRDVIDVAKVLDLAGDAAHAIVRPAAPLTTFVVGYAAGLSAGRGQAGPDAVAEATAVAEQQIRVG